MAQGISLLLNIALVALAAGCSGTTQVGHQGPGGSWSSDHSSASSNGGSSSASGGLGGSSGGTTGHSSNGATGGTQAASGGSWSSDHSSASSSGGSSFGSGGLGGSSGGTTGHSSNVGGATGGTHTSLGGSSTQGCPDSSAYVGNNTWKQQLQVKAGADYCGGWREGRTLEQDLAAKAKLYVAAGTYALPDATGSYSFALPVCFEFPSGVTAPSFAGPGQITQTQSTYAPVVYYRDSIKQPLASNTSTSWSFQSYLSFTSTVGVQPEPLVFDGTGLIANDTFQDLSLCTSDSCAGTVNDIWFDSCNPETYTLNRSTVTFDGGQVVFDVRIAALPGGISESPVFVVASGTLDSVAFEQRDYFKLAYSASHHQFLRSFAVLFDSPIIGACGVKVTTLDPYNGSQLPQAYTIRCDLSNIAQRTVTAAVTERP